MDNNFWSDVCDVFNVGDCSGHVFVLFKIKSEIGGQLMLNKHENQKAMGGILSLFFVCCASIKRVKQFTRLMEGGA